MRGVGHTDSGILRIVVVDANAHIRRLIATLLGALGPVEIVEARTPEIAAVRMLEAPPDLVVVDWTGDPTAVTLFVHRIRRGELVDSRTPVLAMVGPPHNAVLERAWLADEIIAKPISAIDLIDRAGGLVAEWRRRVEAEAETAAAAE